MDKRIEKTSGKYPSIVFMGTPDFAVAQLDALLSAGFPVVGVVTVPDKPAGRGKKISESAVKQFALKQGLPIMQPEKLRSEDFLYELESLHADLFVVVAFRMLPEVVWSMPPLGTLNLHASLLPQYRGAAPINWAIMNGETETGITTFFINEHIDEGALLFKEKIPILKSDNAGSLHDKLMNLGKSLMVKTVKAIAEGNTCPVSQEQFHKEELRPAPKLFKQDALILWNNEGRKIIQKIKGLSPYPAAFTVFKNEKGEELSMKIFDAVFEPSVVTASGELYCDKKNIKISVKDGLVSITDLQLNGKNRMTADAFLRGNQSFSQWQVIS